jgi:hypothetical protein
VYNWVNVGPGDPIEATIALTDKAWRAGHAALYIPEFSMPIAYDDLPVEDVSVLPLAGSLAGWVAPCYATVGFSYSEEDCITYLSSLDRLVLRPYSQLAIDLSLIGLDSIGGDIYWNSSYGGFTLLLSGGPVWNVEFFLSDDGYGCGAYNYPACPYASGEFVVDASTIPVAEPGPLWLIGAALAALALAAHLSRHLRCS